MDKLDRLGWAAGLCFDAYGLQIGIRISVDDPAILDELPALFPPGSGLCPATEVDALYSLIVGRNPAGESSGRRYYHVLYMNSTLVARTMDWDELRERLLLGGRVLVAYNARRELFVAAGALGYRERAIVITGLSQIARTALVAALVRAGCTYLSSEYAPMDRDRGLVVPFANPLPIRDEPGERARQYPIETLGGSAESRALPIGLVAVAEHRPGARSRQRELSRGRAVLALMARTLTARGQPQVALRTLGRAASEAAALEVRFGDVEEAARRLLNYPIWQSEPVAGAGKRRLSA
jgi:hypothetical protein